MNDNQKNSNINSNSPINKGKRKAVNEAGKAAVTAVGGVAGRKIYDLASKTKIGQQTINNVANYNKLKNRASTAGKIVSNITRGSGLSQPIEQNDIENSTNEIENNSAKSSISDKLNQLRETKKKASDLTAKLTNIKLKKIKYITIGIIGLILLIIILFFALFSSDFNLVGDGISDYSEAETLSGYCSNIILVKEDDDYIKDPVNSIDEVDLMEKWDKDNDGKAEALRWSYRTIDLDEYVKHVLQAEAIYVNDEKTFEVAAIMARTYAIEIANKSCYTFDNKNKRDVYRNPQKYSEDTNIDSNISTAVSTTAGIVITLDGVPYNMSNSSYYDLFCYREKRVLNENNEENNYYRLLQENSEEVLDVDAIWANENVPENCATSTGSCYNRSGKLNEGGFTDDCQSEGISLFGAKYLLNKEIDEYTTFRVLKYFLNYDIEFKKIPTQSLALGGGGCYWWPISGGQGRITSNFGPRTAPKAGASTYHKAIDIGGVGNGTTDVIASNSGVVETANFGCVEGDSNCGGKLGNYVKIKHSDGNVTRYGHMYSINVKVGDTVSQGQVIGKVGNTGNSTGAHLDFQIIVNGEPVDPLNYISQSNATPSCTNQNVGTGTIVDTGDNAKTICTSLKNGGFSNEAIAGIMTNMAAESGLNPGAFNGSGGGQGAYGLCQWRGGRQTNLKSLQNYESLTVQLQYVYMELNGSYKKTLSLMQSPGTAGDMVYNWCLTYEVPGRTTQEASANCQTREASKASQTARYLSYAQNNCS